jgi:nuclear pore complex protein Nup133
MPGRFGHQDTAFQLAEKYHDFSSLVALCHKDVAYPPTENPNLDRIQSYVDRFKYDFACQLYRWYIQHGLPLPETNRTADTNII